MAIITIVTKKILINPENVQFCQLEGCRQVCDICIDSGLMISTRNANQPKHDALVKSRLDEFQSQYIEPA